MIARFHVGLHFHDRPYFHRAIALENRIASGQFYCLIEVSRFNAL